MPQVYNFASRYNPKNVALDENELLQRHFATVFKDISRRKQARDAAASKMRSQGLRGDVGRYGDIEIDNMPQTQERSLSRRGKGINTDAELIGGPQQVMDRLQQTLHEEQQRQGLQPANGKGNGKENVKDVKPDDVKAPKKKQPPAAKDVTEAKPKQREEQPSPEDLVERRFGTAKDAEKTQNIEAEEEKAQKEAAKKPKPEDLKEEGEKKNILDQTLRENENVRQQKSRSRDVTKPSGSMGGQQGVRSVTTKDPYFRDEIGQTQQSLMRRARAEDVVNAFAKTSTGMDLGNRYAQQANARQQQLDDFNKYMSERGKTEEITPGYGQAQLNLGRESEAEETSASKSRGGYTQKENNTYAFYGQGGETYFMKENRDSDSTAMSVEQGFINKSLDLAGGSTVLDWNNISQHPKEALGYLKEGLNKYYSDVFGNEMSRRGYDMKIKETETPEGRKSYQLENSALRLYIDNGQIKAIVKKNADLMDSGVMLGQTPQLANEQAHAFKDRRNEATTKMNEEEREKYYMQQSRGR